MRVKSHESWLESLPCRHQHDTVMTWVMTLEKFNMHKHPNMLSWITSEHAQMWCWNWPPETSTMTTRSASTCQRWQCWTHLREHVKVIVAGKRKKVKLNSTCACKQKQISLGWNLPLITRCNTHAPQSSNKKRAKALEKNLPLFVGCLFFSN